MWILSHFLNAQSICFILYTSFTNYLRTPIAFFLFFTTFIILKKIFCKIHFFVSLRIFASVIKCINCFINYNNQFLPFKVTYSIIMTIIDSNDKCKFTNFINHTVEKYTASTPDIINIMKQSSWFICNRGNPGNSGQRVIPDRIL